jgi:hypothetical protein
MKRTLLFLIVFVLSSLLLAQNVRKSQVRKAEIRPFDQGLNAGSEFSLNRWPAKTVNMLDNNRALQKISMSSSLNVNGLFVYEQRYVSIRPEAGMFIFGNRAGGPYKNTGNDLKYKFTLDQGATWDSTVFEAADTKNYRYPSMIVYNPDNSTNPHDMFGIVTGPIYGTSAWTDQYFGSARLDGQYLDMNYQPIETGTYLNHMHIDLYCSPGGQITVASQRLNGVTGAYTYQGWEILNGTFNTASRKVDWQVPYLQVQPELLEEGRIDASRVVWSPDGSIGYLLGTAVDANPDYSPYGIEWPVIYKSTNHGVTWVKEPPFDFSTIEMFKNYLYPTRMDETLFIPRWYNKWVGGERENGAVVDVYGNLHIFGLVTSTMSINPDSINYFYTPEPVRLFDVFMKSGGSWDAYFVDTLISENAPDPGSYGITWDHQMQLTRNQDGSRIIGLWTDTEPFFGPENTYPDIKGFGIDIVNALATPVKNFTKGTNYWGDNYWMRVADQVFYDAGNQQTELPVTTSIPGLINSDPLVHQYCLGMTIDDSEFEFPVGIREAGSQAKTATVSANYPNPFRSSTTIMVNLPEPASLVIEISTVSGKNVMKTDKGKSPAGIQQIVIDGSQLAPGFYFCTLTINGLKYTNKMIVQ